VGGWVYGVADHNVIQVRANDCPFYIWASTYGGTGQIEGHGSWADYPWYGTDKFWFVEDNTIIRTSSEPRGFVDSSFGGRFVIRHNYIHNSLVDDHGTEGIARGCRAKEVYNNTFNSTGSPAGVQRSGTSLWHDNIVTGLEPTNDNLCGLLNFRESPSRSNSPWGIADGTSPWDANDTEGNGIFVEGHQPFVFDQGTDNSSVNSKGVLHDSTKNWTPNQWVGYSVTNYNPVYTSDGIGSYITSNTSNTITYDYYPGTDTSQHMIFNAGDPYKIHRVLIMMDQNGRGKTDLITGSGPFINTTTGTASWAHSALEPCYSWNNVYAPNGHALGFNSPNGQPTTKLNVDYYNLGAGFPANTTPLAVSSTYTAALNGVAYTGTFTYPHPLVSGNPTPSPTPTATATPTATPSPTVTTNPATNIASFAAALNGSVNPRGSTTTVYFQWGTTTAYGHTTSTQTQTGNTSRPITANISGLSASHLYHFRIVATNGGGTSFGSDRTFTTLSATGPPVVTTNPATNVTTSSARLNGSLDPHGLSTTVYFQWGTTTGYGHTTPMQTQTGNTYRNITANISGLSASHLYHFRIVATNSAGTRMGSDRTFNTP
jgi:hypothetical protein